MRAHGVMSEVKAAGTPQTRAAERFGGTASYLHHMSIVQVQGALTVMATKILMFF